jgi:hypothetical protein
VSGAVLALQSAWFALQVYEQLAPLHAAAVAFVLMQATLQPPQLVVVFVGVSQPVVFGGVVTQLAQPAAHW